MADLDERHIRAAIAALQAMLPPDSDRKIGPPARQADEMLSLERAAHEMRVSVSTMRRQARRFGLGSKPFGRWAFSRAELERFKMEAA